MIDNQELLILYLEDELDEKTRAALETRLVNEPDLAAELEELRDVLGDVEEGLPREPGNDYWRNFYQRLQPKLEKQSLLEKIQNWLSPGHGMNYGRAAVALSTLVIAVSASLYFTVLKHPSVGKITVSEVKIEKTESIMSLVVNKHLDKSRLLLEEMVNISDSGELLEEQLEYTKEKGQRLLGINRAYQAAAKKNGNAELEDLLADLELVLMEIANIDVDDASYAIPGLKKVIRKKNLLIKIEIINLDEYRPLKRDKNTEVM